MSGQINNFSIIIPFKTGKHYLLDCLQSVLAQDYPHFEIIILADITSNTDDALHAISDLNNPKISVLLSDKNLDILQNWGRIKDLDKKEYMTILGYDDILSKGFLSCINNSINTNPDASLYHTHFNYINSNSEAIKKCQPLPTQMTASDYLKYTLKESIDIMATGYVFRSKDYDAIGGIPTSYPNLIYADAQLWIELSKKGHLVVDPSIQFSFRIHSSVTKTSKDKILLDAFILFLDYLKGLKQEADNYKLAIQSNLTAFAESTTKAMSHRLLRTPKINRQGLTIDKVTNEIAEKCIQMEVSYAPFKIKSIQIARFIETTPLLNELFLLFKRIYKKPVL
jgi:glycosyltransferase involved in cell wall biosynthesis